MDQNNHKTLIEASQFFAETAKKMLTINGRLHAETLIISVARMSGSLMFRSFNFKQRLVPGTTVMSNEANIHGPKLMNTVLATLQALGHQIGERNLDKQYFSAKFAQLAFKESHNRVAPFFLKYQEAAKMSLEEAAVAAAICAGTLVHECQQVLSADKGAALAVFGLVEGTKTAPYPVGQSVVEPKDSESKGRTWP